MPHPKNSSLQKGACPEHSILTGALPVPLNTAFEADATALGKRSISEIFPRRLNCMFTYELAKFIQVLNTFLQSCFCYNVMLICLKSLLKRRTVPYSSAVCRPAWEKRFGPGGPSRPWGRCMKLPELYIASSMPHVVKQTSTSHNSQLD